MSRYGSGFREPPWVMGDPKEVMDWMEASHPSKKDKPDYRSDKEFLKNLHIRFDFNVEKKVIKSPCMVCRLISLNKIEENIELLPITELVLRGLAKAKFRNTAKIILDGKTIDGLSEFADKISQGKNLEITAILADVEKCIAIIRIKKIHGEKEHSVDIQIKGKIRSEIYHTFLNYLNEKIGLKEET